MFGLFHGDFKNHRLALWDQGALTARQRGEEGQFHSLHRRFDSSQGVAANQHFVSRKDQAKVLLFPFGFEFSKSELVKRQQQTPFSR